MNRWRKCQISVNIKYLAWLRIYTHLRPNIYHNTRHTDGHTDQKIMSRGAHWKRKSKRRYIGTRWNHRKLLKNIFQVYGNIQQVDFWRQTRIWVESEKSLKHSCSVGLDDSLKLCYIFKTLFPIVQRV